LGAGGDVRTGRSGGAAADRLTAADRFAAAKFAADLYSTGVTTAAVAVFSAAAGCTAFNADAQSIYAACRGNRQAAIGCGIANYEH
jgi:hypothetical protein